MSAHLSSDAIAGIAMLAPNDPERREAEAHARGCAECRAQLAEVTAALDALGELAPPPTPAPAMLQRVSEAVLVRMRAPWVSVVILAVLFAATFAFVSRLAPFVSPLPWASLIFALVVGAGRTLFALRRGTAREDGIALAFAVGLGVVLGLVTADESSPRSGAHCFFLELASAAVPASVAVALAVRGKLAPRPLGLAAIAATGGFAGLLGVVAVCPDRHLEHLVPLHVGAVLLAALGGYLVGLAPAVRRASAT